MKVFKFIITSSAFFKYLLLGMIICILLMAVDSNLRPFIIKLIINQSLNFNLKSFIILSSLYIASQIIMIIANSCFDWLGTKYHTQYRVMIAHKYFDELTEYPFSFFQETQSGIITAKITDAFNTIPVIVFTAIRYFIHFILLVVITVAILAQINYLFVIAAILWILIFFCLSQFFYKKYEPLNTEYAKMRPQIFGFLADYFSNILSVWNFTNFTYEKENFTKITSEWRIKSVLCGEFLRNYYFIHGVIVAVYMTIILILLGIESTKGNITPGDFALIFMVNYKIVDMLFEISSMSREFVTNCGVVNNAISLLEQPYIKKDNSVQELIINDKVEIEFRNISFSYYSNNNLFSNLSVKIKSHEKIGLVGYSGSGKSSFINLILKLNEPLAGNILINNQNINEISVESLRRNIAMIPQDPSLFHRTIMDNIRYGKITASDEEIIEAAKAAKAHNFIMNLADGYNTIVGERGIKLSGGQRQRIAIARAIVKKAPILILDEATSQLDSLTENDIQDSLHPLMNSSTTIAIAHRLSTLLHMDRILVFDEGKIVQDGTHKQLIASDGVYKSMWDTQIGGFLPEKRERSAEC